MKDGHTIGQWLKWDFKTDGNLEIRDKNGRAIYWESSDGIWRKREYDSQGNQIYYEALNGYWAKWEYDSKGNVIYAETSGGYWEKREWNSYGNLIYHENSNGGILDRRPKPSRELTLESLAEDVLKLSELLTRFVNQVNQSNTTDADTN